MINRDEAMKLIDNIKVKAREYCNKYFINMNDSVIDVGDKFKDKLDSVLEHVISIKIGLCEKDLNEYFSHNDNMNNRDFLLHICKIYSMAEQFDAKDSFSLALLMAQESLNKAYIKVMREYSAANKI